LYLQFDLFKEVFIEYFFLKIRDFNLTIDDEILVIYFNLYLNSFFYEFLNNKELINSFIDKIITTMFFRIFVQFSNESNDTQLR
jgi:hypothetical protein